MFRSVPAFCRVSGLVAAVVATLIVVGCSNSGVFRYGPVNSLTITTPFPTQGKVGLYYEGLLGVSGGTSPYTCTGSGTLPPTLTLSSSCSITGTPTTAGTYTFSVAVEDSSSPQLSDTAFVTITISAATSQRLAVLSGNLPVVGANMQVYAAGTTGNGSTPTALLVTPLTTDSNGTFTLPSISCPTSTSIVFIVATGGKAGTDGATNSGIKLMSSPGACSTLATLESLTINELTTVASAYAFSQFMATGGNIGATSSNLSGITLAAGTEANLANIATGAIPGPGFPSSTGTAPIAKMNVLATLLFDCIISDGSTSSACNNLYSHTAVGSNVPSNTLDAVLNLAKNPATNVQNLYALLASASPLSPYTPIPAAAPSDWTLYINYTGGGMNNPTAVSIDSNGRIWVANYASTASLFANTGVPIFPNGLTGNSLLNSYGGAVDASDNFWVANEEGGSSNLGTISVFTPTGQVASNSPYKNGGLDFPIAIAFDTLGYGWIVDYGDSHLSILSNSGSVATSNSSGYTSNQLVFPVAIAIDGNRKGWLANQSSNTVTSVSFDGSTFTSYAVGSGPADVAVDNSNNVWSANYDGNSIGLITNAGVVASPGGGFTGGGVNHPRGIAVDGTGTVWVINYRGSALSELMGENTSGPGTAISPSSGWAPDVDILEGFGIAIDQAGNIWVTSSGNNTLAEFVGLATPVRTPLIGPAVAP